MPNVPGRPVAGHRKLRWTFGWLFSWTVQLAGAGAAALGLASPGRSVAVRLLGTFVPVVLVAMLAGHLLSSLLGPYLPPNPALIKMLPMVLAVLAVSLAAGWVGCLLGDRIDRIERERAQALARLDKAERDLSLGVQRRTAELEGANARLCAEVQRRQLACEELYHSHRLQESILGVIPDWLIHLRGERILQVRMPRGLETEFEGLDSEAGRREWVKGFIAQYSEILRKTAQDGQVLNFDCALPAGTEVHTFEAHVAPLAAQEMVILLHDVTLQKALQRNLLEAVAQEQVRIGQDLHDGLGQLLTGIGFLSAALADHLQQQNRPEAREAAEITGLVSKAISWTRKLARGLAAQEIGATGLLPALTDLLEDTRALFKVECVLDHDGGPLPSSPNAVMHLYRIAQEAIHNAVRHGRATRIHLALASHQGRLVFSIHDNGTGFPPHPPPAPLGLGIQIMQHRARQAGGALTFHSSPESGATVLCILPGETPQPFAASEAVAS